MIAARSGNSLPVFPGEGVKTSDDGREFFATRDGQVIYNTDMLSVLPTYQVLGDVDYHSGNIEFDGNIFVTGSILPGFFVKAKGDILVQGNVESANIEAGRDLIVKGGIVGAGSMPIRTGRNLVAHHLQNASIEVEGNVVIMNSCLHSIVETSGDFTCIEQKGVLLGGSLVCLKGAEVRVLGSDAGATTKVILGQDFLVRKKIKEAQAALDFINAGIKKIETYLTPLLTKISKENIPTAPEQLQRLKMILDRRKEMTSQQNLLRNRINRLESSANLISGVKLKVHGTLYPDVKVQLSHVHWCPESELNTVEMTLDTSTGKVKLIHFRT